MAGYDSIEDYERDVYGLHSESEEESDREAEQELYQQVHYGQGGYTSHCQDGVMHEDDSPSNKHKGNDCVRESNNNAGTGEREIVENNLDSDREDGAADLEESVVLLKVLSKRNRKHPVISLVSTSSDNTTSDTDESSDESALTPPPAKKQKTDNQSNSRPGGGIGGVHQSKPSSAPQKTGTANRLVFDAQELIVLSSSESEPEWTVIDELYSSCDEGMQTNLIGVNEDSSSFKTPSGELWNIHPEDIVNNVQNSEGKYRTFSKPNRYYTPKTSIKCHNCGKTGHLSKSCSSRKKMSVCFLCAEEGHNGWKCPNQICLFCDEIGHHFKQCSLRPWQKLSKVCTRCNMKGHSNKDCPDRWRQFLATTEPGELIKLTVNVKNKNNYCCNCAKRGHLEYECTRPRMDRLYSPTTPFICRYDNWSDVKNRFEQLRKNQTYQDMRTAKEQAQKGEREKKSRARNNHVFFDDEENDVGRRGKKRKLDNDYVTNNGKSDKKPNKKLKKKTKKVTKKSSETKTEKVKKPLKLKGKAKGKGQDEKKSKKQKDAKQIQNKQSKSGNSSQASHGKKKQKKVKTTTEEHFVAPNNIHIEISTLHDLRNPHRNITCQNGSDDFPRSKRPKIHPPPKKNSKKTYSKSKSKKQQNKAFSKTKSEKQNFQTKNQLRKVKGSYQSPGSKWIEDCNQARGAYLSNRGFRKVTKW